MAFVFEPPHHAGPGALAAVAPRGGTLRVLIVIENMSYTYDTRMQKIARALVARGNAVTVLCPRYPGDPPSSRDGAVSIAFYRMPRTGDGILGHVLEYAAGFGVVAGLSFLHALREGFDVVHVCNPPDIFFPLAWLCRAFGKRFVFDVHDLCPELSQVRHGRRPLVHRAMLALERWTARGADHVLVTSETARRRLVARTGIAEERVTLVYNGPDPALLQAGGDAGGRGFVEVGYVGEMNPQDGIDNLLRAAHHIAVTMGRTDVRFVCIGDGSSFEELRRTVGCLGLGDVVTFTGRLKPRDAMARLASCDLCVLPDPKNPFTDSCVMVKSLEYMALGKAFAAFDLTETRAVCADAAVYASEESPAGLARAILALADDARLRAEVGQAGRRRIEERFQWPLCAAELLRAYDTLARPVSEGAAYISPSNTAPSSPMGLRLMAWTRSRTRALARR